MRRRATWVRGRAPRVSVLLPNQMPVELFLADAEHEPGPRRSTWLPVLDSESKGV